MPSPSPAISVSASLMLGCSSGTRTSETPRPSGSADARPWVPHLTLSRPLGPHHLGTEAVAEALCAVGEVVAPHLPPDVGGSALRWWDPGAGTASVLAGRA